MIGTSVFVLLVGGFLRFFISSHLFKINYFVLNYFFKKKIIPKLLFFCFINRNLVHLIWTQNVYVLFISYSHFDFI